MSGQEYCHSCGRGYLGMGFWMADDALWARVTGRSDGVGLLCPDCFGGMAQAAGLLLRWTPTVESETEDGRAMPDGV